MISASNLPAIIATLTFAAVILSIALDWLDLAVAGLLGAIFLRLLGIVSKDTAVSGDQCRPRHDRPLLRRDGGGACARSDRNLRLSRRHRAADSPRRRPASVAFDNRTNRTDLRDPAQRYSRHPVCTVADPGVPQDGDRFRAADNAAGFCRQRLRTADPGRRSGDVHCRKLYRNELRRLSVFSEPRRPVIADRARIDASVFVSFDLAHEGGGG